MCHLHMEKSFCRCSSQSLLVIQKWRTEKTTPSEIQIFHCHLPEAEHPEERTTYVTAQIGVGKPCVTSRQNYLSLSLSYKKCADHCWICAASLSHHNSSSMNMFSSPKGSESFYEVWRTATLTYLSSNTHFKMEKYTRLLPESSYEQSRKTFF